MVHDALANRCPSPTTLIAGLFALWLTTSGCSPAVEEPAYVVPSMPPSASSSPSTKPHSTASTATPLAVASNSSSATVSAAPPQPCPADMVYVDAVHCRRVGLKCVKHEYEKSNKLTICHRYTPQHKCLSAKRRQRFCIDRYEYPSRKGAHPPTMVSAHDAAGLCAERGKRLCWESEWEAACEGPQHLPFPYGYERDKTKCNISRSYRNPSLKRMTSRNRRVQARELAKLDQSHRSGAMDSCQSGYGVYDLTGNHDEWVLTEIKRGTSEWSGLKGGHWLHVRNACRPITVSHAAHWSYYLVSFRCCKDPVQAAVPPSSQGSSGLPLWTPPPAPTPAPPGGAAIFRGWTPDRPVP